MTPLHLPIDHAPAHSSFMDGDTRIQRSVTPSGTRILSQEIPGTHSVGISLFVPVGSRDEAPEHAGSTHFLEHLLFKGTRRRSAFDIAAAFDGVGGESNAETAREYTSYWARVLGEDLEMAVDVLADMVTDSLIEPEHFEMEREVILDELAMADDSPTDVLHEAFQTAVHGDVPLGRPVGGTPEVIRRVSRQDVWTHYQDSYGPDALIVAAAGRVDHERLLAMVDEALASSAWAERLEEVKTPRPRRSTAAPAPVEHEHRIVHHRDVEQAHLILGTRGLRARHEDWAAMSVLLSVLGGSMSSRLFQEVREKRGMAYSTYAFETAYADTGSFGMYAGTSPSKVEEVGRIMIGQLEDLASSGPTEEELERVRGQVRGGIALGLEDNWSRMMRLGRAEMSGDYRTVADTLAAIDEVGAEDVRALAADLASRPRSIALVLPKDA